MPSKPIVILGVGNILLKDEGVGVHVIERLGDNYRFAPGVALVDGGTLGLQLLGTVAEADHLIVIDAVKNGGLPGMLYRFKPGEMPTQMSYKHSLHQVGLLEALTVSQSIGNTPETVIIGVEPEDTSPWGVKLTPAVQEKVPELIHMVLKELDRLSIRYTSINGRLPKYLSPRISTGRPRTSFFGIRSLTGSEGSSNGIPPRRDILGEPFTNGS